MFLEVFPSFTIGDRIKEKSSGLLGTLVDFSVGMVLVKFDHGSEETIPVGDLSRRVDLVSDLPQLAQFRIPDQLSVESLIDRVLEGVDVELLLKEEEELNGLPDEDEDEDEDEEEEVNE